MSHTDIIAIENTAGRVMRAVGQFAEAPQERRLRHAEFILSEVRFAAQWLCSPDATPEEREQATARLVGMFALDLS